MGKERPSSIERLLFIAKDWNLHTAKVVCSVACFEWLSWDKVKRMNLFKYTASLFMSLKF